MKIYNIGFFGAPNFGDEVICKANVKLFKEIGADEIIICSSNIQNSKEYSNLWNEKLIEGFWPKPEFIKNIFRRLRYIKNSDVIVIGGGGLINDYYTSHSILRYILDAFLGVIFNKKVIFWSIGVVNARLLVNKILLKILFNYCKVSIFVRDNYSKKKLEEIGIISKIEICVDSCIGLYNHKVKKQNVKQTPFTVVNFRKDPKKYPEFVHHVIKESAKSIDATILFVAAEPPDEEYLRDLSTKYENSNVVVPSSVDELLQLIDEAQLVIAERLHFNLIAHCRNKELYPVIYEEKVKTNLNTFGFSGNYYDINSVELKEMVASQNLNFEEAWENNKNFFKRAIKRPSKNSLLIRFISVLVYGGALIYSVLYSFLIIIKRIMFGRGKLW